MSTISLFTVLLISLVVKEGQGTGILPPPPLPPLDCRVVLCAIPNCDNPIPAKPGQCCPTCPDDPTSPPSPPLRCPNLPRDRFGICVERCSADDGCPKGQLCCSNGCGHVCTAGVPDVCQRNGMVYQVGESFPAGDGCNTCTCSSGGLIGCTKIGCIPPTTVPPPPTCPPGVPVVACLVDPCEVTKCPAHPNARCVADFCGGCNAKFFENGEEVTDTCNDVCVRDGMVYNVGDTFPAGDGCNTCTCSSGGLIACTEIACIPPTTVPPPPTCPPDKPLVNCFVNPCKFGKCPAHPNARCVADFCGGCNARFFENGEEVTDTCNDVCVSGGVVHEVGDSFPAGDGCNRCSCIRPNVIVCTLIACPFPTTGPPPTTVPPPPTCPPDKPLVNCFVNPCKFGKCPAHPNARCVADFCGGCNARFFENGEEVTDTCNDVCVSGGVVHKVGDSFPAGDGCNRCSCIRPNVIVCTLIACPPPTTGPPPTTSPPPTTVPPPPTCPPGVPVVACLVDPCEVTKCPAHPNARCVADFCGGCNARFFENGEEVTDTCKCPVKGQVFKQCGSACPANCTNPTPICTRQCVQRCECPRGMVINEAKNKCVRTRRCPSNRCPPTCSAAFCKRNRWDKCTLPGPREIPGCTGTCQFTFCSACYFSAKPRPLPGRCPTCGGPISSVRCFKKWARCIGRADFLENRYTPRADRTEENFKCYRYPCPLRG